MNAVFLALPVTILTVIGDDHLLYGQWIYYKVILMALIIRVFIDHIFIASSDQLLFILMILSEPLPRVIPLVRTPSRRALVFLLTPDYSSLLLG